MRSYLTNTRVLLTRRRQHSGHFDSSAVPYSPRTARQKRQPGLRRRVFKPVAGPAHSHYEGRAAWVVLDLFSNVADFYRLQNRLPKH